MRQKENPTPLTSQDRILFRRLATELNARAFRDLMRRAAGARKQAQSSPRDPRSRWSVERWAVHLHAAEGAPEVTARVVSIEGTSALVFVQGEERRVAKPSEPLVAGDEVALSADGKRIERILPRKSLLNRLDPATGQPRAIVANVDVVVAVAALQNPPLRPRLLDRIAVAARAGESDFAVVITKADLATAEAGALLETVRRQGYAVWVVSSLTGEGVPGVQAGLRGRVAAFVGHSGVGKTSLLNALTGLELRTGETSEATGKGRHTTTVSRFVETADGLKIIDTPGIREFGISPEDALLGFPEIAAASERCRMPRCRHETERECAVRLGLESGAIARERFLSYQRLVEDDDEIPRSLGFICVHCGMLVSAEGGGTEHRNHCPHCLRSVHLDHRPGDRSAGCGGTMEPVAVWVRKGGE